MSFSSLKKCEQLAERQPIDVDTFIEGANAYARGQAQILTWQQRGSIESEEPENDDGHFKRATFSLGESAIRQLTKLADSTGIPKSRLIRIWLENESRYGDLSSYLQSKVK